MDVVLGIEPGEGSAGGDGATDTLIVHNSDLDESILYADGARFDTAIRFQLVAVGKAVDKAGGVFVGEGVRSDHSEGGDRSGLEVDVARGVEKVFGGLELPSSALDSVLGELSGGERNGGRGIGHGRRSGGGVVGGRPGRERWLRPRDGRSGKG